MLAEHLRDLLALCRRDGRICPAPKAWENLWKILPAKEHVDGNWKPSLPLILAGWHHSSDAQKAARMEEHIRWAVDHGAFQDVRRFLTELPSEQWHTETRRW